MPPEFPGFADVVPGCEQQVRGSFRQIGEVLPSCQKVLIPLDLSLDFCDLGIGLAQTLFQGFDLGQEGFPTGLRCLKLQ